MRSMWAGRRYVCVFMREASFGSSSSWPLLLQPAFLPQRYASQQLLSVWSYTTQLFNARKVLALAFATIFCRKTMPTQHSVCGRLRRGCLGNETPMCACATSFVHDLVATEPCSLNSRKLQQRVLRRKKNVSPTTLHYKKSTFQLRQLRTSATYHVCATSTAFVPQKVDFPAMAAPSVRDVLRLYYKKSTFQLGRPRRTTFVRKASTPQRVHDHASKHAKTQRQRSDTHFAALSQRLWGSRAKFNNLTKQSTVVPFNLSKNLVPSHAPRMFRFSNEHQCFVALWLVGAVRNRLHTHVQESATLGHQATWRSGWQRLLRPLLVFSVLHSIPCIPAMTT